jgi:diguanylate cyclase (GGDEF)-like protein
MLHGLLLLVLLPVQQQLYGNEPERPAHERGLPIIRNYSARALRSTEHPFDASTYAALQTPSGALLFANDAGLLRFDGIRWRTSSGAIGTPFGLTIGPDGEVYASYTSKLARLSEALDGRLLEHDLADLAQPGVQIVRDFWVAAGTSREVYFGSADQLLRLADGRLSQIEAKGPYSFGSVAHERLFVNALGRGVVWVHGERSGLLAGSEFLAEHRVYGVLEQPDGMALLLLDGQGLYRFDASRPESPTLQPFAEALAQRLTQARVYSGLALRDGGFAIGTRTAGVFLLDRDGTLVRHLDQAAGLASNVVFHLLEDYAGQIWVSHDQDLSVIEYPGQLSVFDQRQGVVGPPERVGRSDGALHLSTRSGAYLLQPDPTAPAGANFRVLLPEQVTVSDTIRLQGQTLAASEWGLYSEVADTFQLTAGKVLRGLLPLQDRPGWMLSVGGAGVLLWQRQPDRWLEHPTSNALQTPVDLLLEHQGRYWVSAGVQAPLTSFGLDWTRGELPRVVELREYGAEAGVPGAPVLPQVLDGQLLLATLDGLLLQLGERFIAAPDFQQFQRIEGRHPWQIQPLGEGRLLLHDRQRIACVERDPAGQWLRQPCALDRLPGGSVIKSVLVEADGVVWIATDSELYRHDPASQSGLPPAPMLSVLGIALDAAMPVLAAAGRAPTQWQPQFSGPRDLHFEFAASPATLTEGLRFRSQLEGYDRQWSDWSNRSEREYTNLPSGSFRFRVQAQDMYGQRSPEAVLELRIAPRPWQHPLAWLLYAIIALVGVWLLVRWRLRRLAQRNRALEAEVRARTADLREAALRDPLTGLHNRRYLSELLQADRNDPVYATHYPLRLADDTRPLLLGLIDIDHFKQVNDRHGHAAGDAVLRAVGQAIEHQLGRASPGPALVCRWGGEEFLFACRVEPGESETQVIEGLLDQVTRASAGSLPPQSVVSASIGWLSLSSLTLVELDAVLGVADQLLYRAKRAGRAQAFGVVRAAHAGSETVGINGEVDSELQELVQLPDGLPRSVLRIVGESRS